MKYPYLEKYEEQDCVLALFAKAFSHPVRVRILRSLYEKGPTRCGDIVDQFPLTFAAISRHLKILRGARMIRGEAEGIFIRYRIEPSLRKLFAKQLKEIRGRKIHTEELKETSLEILTDALAAILEFPSDMQSYPRNI